MAKELWIIMLQCLLLLECYLVISAVVVVGVEEKAEAADALVPVPVTTSTVMAPPPPEGNTTFLGGTTWCIALPASAAGVVSQHEADLQAALDWACSISQGRSDCRPIKEGGPCYLPDTLVSHASFAFNTYFQQNGNSDIACNFGGTATLTNTNPSYGKCAYLSSGESSSSATPLLSHKPDKLLWKWNPLQFGLLVLILLFLFEKP